MIWPALFTFTNAVAVATWAALALAPRRPAVLSLVLYAGVGLLCLVYAMIFANLLLGMADPGRLAGAAPGPPEYTIAGIRGLFQSDAGLVLGWTHYLAFDLFVGLWIARDADAKGFGRAVQLPLLIMTFVAGPVGLLFWLLVRERRARLLARRRA